MSKIQESTIGEDSEEQYGVILGYWDQENTPTLIKDLEQSVNLVETKCKKLLQELKYYKKYLEESQSIDTTLHTFKRKKIHSENSPSLSGSTPDVTFRKNLLISQEFIEVFEEKFQAKLLSIHSELTKAAEKIGLRKNIIFFPNEDYLQTFSTQTEEEIEKCWSEIREEFIKANCIHAKAKSDPKIVKNVEFSKITQNELKLYQKLSRISFKKNKRNKKSLRVKILSPVGRKVKFGFKKKMARVKLVEDVKEVSVIKKKEKKRLKKKIRNRGTVKNKKIKTYPSHSSSDSSSTISQKKVRINDSKIENMCNSLMDAIHKCSQQTPNKPVRNDNPIGLTDLGPIPKKTIPFTACTSTSKSHNIGMNIQQYLSLSKYRNKPDSKGQTPQKKHESSPTKMRTEKECKANFREGRTKSDSFEMSQVEHKGKVWISKRCTSDFRKVRSKYTGSSPEGFLGYHKSTMSQYTNGQKSMIKSESKTAYAVGSKIMVSDCRRTDFFEFDKEENFFENASGDGTCNDRCAKLKMEWSKVFGSFLDVYRKYTALKEQSSNNDMTPSEAELNPLEKEIDSAIDKYKEFLKFYSKFLQLKHRLKTIKIACETDIFGPVTSFSLNCHKQLDSSKPTNSMAMKKIFREVQALQEKIRLVDDF